MFTKTIIKEVKVIDESKVKELESRIKELEQEKVQIRKDSESEKRIKENEIHIYVQKAVEDKNNENNILKSENATLKKEVEILEKAFENMGFDVKDMKDILNKLVAGIVTGKQIGRAHV